MFYIVGLLVPERQNIMPLAEMRALLVRKGFRAELSAFWHGACGAKHPPIPKAVSAVMKLLPAEIEVDFATAEQGPKLRRA